MPNIWKLKQEICEVGRLMYQRGLVTAFEGNISARIGPDRVLCTPSLVCKGMLKPEDLCVVDMAGNQLDGRISTFSQAPASAPAGPMRSQPGGRKRSSEIFLHLAVYRERPDVEAVVHAHPPHASAFAVTRTALPQCVTAEVEVFLGPVPLAPYATPGTPELGESIVPLVRDANAVLLSNHGTVSWGKTPDEAFHRTEILEAYCRTLILAQQIGPLQRLGDSNMRELMALKQKLGLPDRRAGQERFDNCDLCGNNEFGRGFCQAGPPCGDAQPGAAAPAQPAAPASPDFDEVVREITERVWSAVSSPQQSGRKAQ